MRMINVSLIKVMQLMKEPGFNGNSLFFSCHLKGSYQVLSFGKNFMILVWARAITFDEGRNLHTAVDSYNSQHGHNK